MSSKRRSILYDQKASNSIQALDIDEFDDNTKLPFSNITNKINRRYSRLPIEE